MAGVTAADDAKLHTVDLSKLSNYIDNTVDQ